MSPYETVTTRSQDAVLATNKLIRNTYTLLSMTLLFSAVMASVSMFMNLGPMTNLLSTGGALVLIWFVLPRTANSAAGLAVVFGITGLLGLGLGPLLNLYLHMSNGSEIIGLAMGGTGAIFLSLSGYALTTRRNFSFMGGFLFTGIIVLLLAMLANVFLELPALQLAISAAVILVMSGFILYNTSQMIHEPNTNYLLMTVSLYLNILNIFVSLLNILGALSGDD
jgi:modulator of FtsH protease